MRTSLRPCCSLTDVDRLSRASSPCRARALAEELGQANAGHGPGAGGALFRASPGTRASAARRPTVTCWRTRQDGQSAPGRRETRAGVSAASSSRRALSKGTKQHGAQTRRTCVHAGHAARAKARQKALGALADVVSGARLPETPARGLPRRRQRVRQGRPLSPHLTPAHGPASRPCHDHACTHSSGHGTGPWSSSASTADLQFHNVGDMFPGQLSESLTRQHKACEAAHVPFCWR